MSELTKQGLLSLRGRGHRLKVENLIFANELMPLLGELDRALTLEGKLEGCNLAFPSPCWDLPVKLKLAVVKGASGQPGNQESCHFESTLGAERRRLGSSVCGAITKHMAMVTGQVKRGECMS